MWADLKRHPSHLAVLALCAVAVVLLQRLRWDWYIDDAAICFSYARNIANGEGIVPWPGGERIEGFSDPTWIALLVGFEWIGLDGFLVAKPLAMLFSVACIPVVYRTARLAMPDHDGPAPLFAAVALAFNAQFAIWSASALENSLWCLLLSIAIHQTVIGGRTGRFFGSSLAWLLVSLTRPEGIVYAAAGAFWFMSALALQGRSMRPVAGWLAVFWLPTYALEAARLWYFAWPLPNTWYAKVDSRATFPLNWNERGWDQAREYAKRLWQGYYLPVYVIGLLTLRRPQGRIAVAVIAIVGLTLLWPAPENLTALSFWPHLPEAPPGWIILRIGLLVGAAVLLPFASIGVPGWDVRALSWHCAAIAVLFSVYANGDWMGAYRWMSLMAPCAAVLLACGMREIVDWIELRSSGGVRWQAAGWLTAAFGLCALIPPNVAQLRDHIGFNRNETPAMVKLRADYTASVAQRTFVEGRIVNLEMDQGAHLWWYPQVYEIDMAGLVDVPMARHTYNQRAFVSEYVFGEHTPTFAHVHGWWGNTMSRFPTYEQWDDYVELPPYADLPGFPPHPGVWARRDLFVTNGWKGPDRETAFAEGFFLRGFSVPGEIWPVGGDGFLEVGFSSSLSRVEGHDVRVVAFLTDGTQALASWELPLGYGLFGMQQWREGDVFVGRYPLPIPEDVAPGRYALGFVAFAPDGYVLPAGGGVVGPDGVIGGTEDVPAVVAAGEVRFPRMITVVAAADVDARAAAARDEVLTNAKSGKCEAAERQWILAKRVRPRAWAWQAEELPTVRRALADCWARRAERDWDLGPEWLANAHRWDHESPELARVGERIGRRLWEEGMEAREQEDWQAAYERFDAVLKFQPWRSWARRYAEEARDHRLGLRHDEEEPDETPSRPGGDERIPGADLW